MITGFAIRSQEARTRRISAGALSNVQPSLGCQLRQPLLGAPGAEQRDALRSEPLLGDRHELLERIIAGLAKELDRSRRLTEPYATRQVVNDAAPTRSRAARGEGAKVVVVALDGRSSPLPSQPPPNLDSPAGRTVLWRAFTPAKVSLNSEPFCLRVLLTGYKPSCIPRKLHRRRVCERFPLARDTGVDDPGNLSISTCDRSLGCKQVE